MTAMAPVQENINIKTWTSRVPAPHHAFYILSKGENAGRPMDKSCPNCFIVSCRNENERNTLFGLSLALWHAGSFQHFLRGSVVPFIVIRHVQSLLSDAYHNFLAAPDHQRAQIETLRKLDALEKLKRKEINLIKQLKHTLARKHFFNVSNIQNLQYPIVEGRLKGYCSVRKRK